MPDTVLTTALPDYDAATVTAEQFQDALQRHSVILLRNAVSPERVQFMRQLVVNVYNEYDRLMPRRMAGEDVSGEAHYTSPTLWNDLTPAWFNNFRKYGSILLAYNPMASEEVVQTISQFSFLPFVETFLGGTPMLGLNPSSVRMGDPFAGGRCLFHQDGQFLGGPGIKTLNTWVALDDCGVDAPGVEVIPQRVSDILTSGSDGVDMAWEITDDTVFGRFGGRQASWAPQMNAGDVLAFDQMNVHRTHITAGMNRLRYALECWMFPAKQDYDLHLLSALDYPA